MAQIERPEPDDRLELSKLIEVDRTIHEPARAAIMAVLYGVKSADFKFLLETTQLTKGNLSVHARKLAGAEYLTITKSFRNNYPYTEYSLTKKGKAAFKAYVNKLELLSKALND
jgi:DNA-binding transcriptional ArsR family regulator